MKHFIFSLFIILLSFPAFAADKQSTFDRVMESGTIRCGYGLWAPALIRDPNTGEFSGIFYDYVEELGKLLNLKIEWAVEVNLATYLEDLNAGKFDLECSGGWPNAFRGKFVDYTTPIFFTPVFLYGRADETRFNSDINQANNPDIRFSVMDGETSEQIKRQRFPLASEIAVPPSNPMSELLDQVRYKKADLIAIDSMEAIAYMREHTGAIKKISDKPLRITENNMTVPAGEDRFRHMLDIATRQLLNDGVIEQILKKYNVSEDEALRVLPPYQKQQD
ncbi:MAG: transporter substrate-binding domain-containing protein [Alphaproteobacteria bacterium]|nr:transporter substrate-binding domain-containing protein [Alphaproteobacteria bacterium]